ncbi:PD-(D/E)XK nuclease family protein [Desulfovibrio sp. OttesenSCG-928-G15]|nr:PD-(D/E)XK nuclease family protein [Desulfovibrio sp. OttesenSCG-928-G15]
MQDALSKQVSASLLDAYMRCPARFYYERLIGLTPADEVREGDDPPAIGNLFHFVLKNIYAPLENTLLPGGDALESMLYSRIMEDFFTSPDYRALCENLSADSRAMLAQTAKKHMADYLRAQPPTRPLALEKELTASFTRNGKSWSLKGIIDRMDMRPGSRKYEQTEDEQPGSPLAEKSWEIVILDYKTGRVQAPASGFWTDTDLFARLAAWQPGEDNETALLQELASRMRSVQLPLYLLLHALHSEATGQGELRAAEACWVALGERGQEVSLFPKKISGEERDAILRIHIPEIVYFLLRHMSESSQLAACPGQHCLWCSAAKLCKVHSKSAIFSIP